MNRAYKAFTATYKLVYPQGVKETECAACRTLPHRLSADSTVEDIVRQLNALHAQSKASPTSAAPAHRGWGLLRSKQASDPRSASSLDLPVIAKQKSSSSFSSLRRGNSGSSKTAPATPISVTPTEEKTHEELTAMIDEKLQLSELQPSWQGDALGELVIGGSAFGHGLFELVFALLPWVSRSSTSANSAERRPKLRKTASWFGYSTGNRSTALKLLSVAAMGSDVHACAALSHKVPQSSPPGSSFASLCLLTY
jgi:hypothetical protein